MVTTRTKSYDSNIRIGEQELRDPASESLNDRRRRWSHLLRLQHYQPVIEEVLNEELPKYENSVIINVTDKVSYLRECALILASAPSVFAAAVHGNLVQQMQLETDVKRDYASVQERAQNQPSIYINLLADECGIAPTPKQYLIIRDIVIDYLLEGQESEHAWHLDNITLPSVTQRASVRGHRKYLCTKNRSQKRVETLHRFCQGVLNRCSETHSSVQDTPFEFPPGECGYSKDSHTRLKQHCERKSSNYVMNLIEDICTYLHQNGTLSQHFRMHQFIIYLIFRPSQAAIAEIFCSGLLQVWIENGGGFNAYPAGRSVASSRSVSPGEWDDHERWVRQHSPIIHNMRVQMERADEWQRALEWEQDGNEDSKMTEGSDEAGDSLNDDCM